MGASWWRGDIRTLVNFDPPATDDEVRAAVRQFVRKISGFVIPTRNSWSSLQTGGDKLFKRELESIDPFAT